MVRTCTQVVPAHATERVLELERRLPEVLRRRRVAPLARQRVGRRGGGVERRLQPRFERVRDGARFAGVAARRLGRLGAGAGERGLASTHSIKPCAQGPQIPQTPRAPTPIRPCPNSRMQYSQR